MSIQNAKDMCLSETNDLPDVSDGVISFLQKVRIGVVQTQMLGGRAQEIVKYSDTLACRQPMAENLAIRKEGDRSWRWHVIYVSRDVELNTNDVIILSGVRYRIMEKTNWQEYGYFSYNAIEDYVKEVTG